MGVLTIERLGGLARFGLPGSRVRSRGQIEVERLSIEERRVVDRLFAHHSGNVPPAPDAFVYRLSRPAGDGTECVEVEEAQLPRAVIECLKDELI